MAGLNNALKITLEQTEDGAVLSTLTLNYPSLENATANVLSLAMVDAITGTVDQWAGGKAELIGEGELYQMADVLRKGKGKAAEPAKPEPVRPGGK